MSSECRVSRISTAGSGLYQTPPWIYFIDVILIVYEIRSIRYRINYIDKIRLSSIEILNDK